MTEAVLILSHNGQAGLEEMTAPGSVSVVVPVAAGEAETVLADRRIGSWIEAGAIVALEFACVADAHKVEAAINGGVA